MAVALLLAFAGCGSSSSGEHQAAARFPQAGPGTEITVKHVPKAGAVLAAGPRHRTVYAFERDAFHPTRSGCTGACEAKWPPVLTKGRPVAAAGAAAGLLTTIQRPNGSLQLSYKGHPLYYFSGDKLHRDILGEGTEGLWYVLAPEGIEILVRGKLP